MALGSINNSPSFAIGENSVVETLFSPIFFFKKIHEIPGGCDILEEAWVNKLLCQFILQSDKAHKICSQASNKLF